MTDWKALFILDPDEVLQWYTEIKPNGDSGRLAWCLGQGKRM